MNYLDLFAGIGGFHEGLKQAGFKFDWVGFSEIDKYAKQKYKKHFPEAEDLGDVRTIDTGRLPRIDLITYGFPCQDISVAGKRRGLAGERSGLFSEAIRIIRDTQPDYFIFENVKGLFSSNQGRDFEYILRTIADMGYDYQWQLLNTRWVLPQNRERIYFVGYPRNTGGQEIFPIEEGTEISKEKDRGQPNEGKRILSTIDSRYGSLRNAGETYLIQVGVINKDAQGQRVYSPDGIACSLTGCSGGHGGNTGLYMINERNNNGKLDDRALESKERFQENRNMPSLQSGEENRVSPQERGLARPQAREHSGSMQELPYQNSSPQRMSDLRSETQGVGILRQTLPKVRKVGQPSNDKTQSISPGCRIRRLTCTECEKLQGFEVGWTEGISDSQRYKCLGNAVTVPIVKLVGEKLINVIRKERE